MAESPITSYDVVAYPSFVFLYTHPNRLATLATLFGMKPAPVEKCRVLEIGCFDGANLAGMAMGLPGSEFVGVDAAGTAIARGRAMAQEVGLKNLTLRHVDIMDMAPDYGRFDYIIVHGVYTWVPPAVAEQIMTICSGSLAPQGVAYISYNALPGCHNRLMIREMMQYHNRDFHDAQQKMREGFNLLKLLANSLDKQSGPYAQFLQEEFERISGRSLESLYHDELSEVFSPLYFYQFMEQAERHDLQFLSEADFFDMTSRGLNPSGVELLDQLSEHVLLREQYLDFMRGRHFRKTLLCRQDIALNRKLNSDCVRPYYISTLAKPSLPAPNLQLKEKETFANSNGAALTTPDPVARTLLWYLTEKDPERIPVEQLATEVTARAREQFGIAPDPNGTETQDIIDFIWVVYRAGLVDLHIHVPPYVTHISDQPLASPLARWQASRSNVVSTLHHRALKFRDAVGQALLTLLDGSRDRAALRSDVRQLFASGKFELLDDAGKPITDMSAVDKAIDEQFDDILQRAVRSAVLMG